jgi:hypothetical protein
MVRRTNQVADFLEAFNKSYGMARQVSQDVELGKIAKATPEQTNEFTADQGAQLGQAVAAGGVPTWNEANKSYSVETPLPEGQQGPVEPQNFAMQGVTNFLGQSTPGTMTEDQVSNARQRAMAGVIMGNDPEKGTRMLRDVRQGEREVVRDERDAVTFAQGQTLHGLNLAQAQRVDRAAQQTEADDNAMREIDAQTSAAFKSKITNPDGTTRQVTPDDLLAITHEKANLLAQKGFIKQATALSDQYAAGALMKLKTEQAQREAALKNIQPGDFKAVASYYNKFIPDGAQITEIVPGKDGALLIKRTNNDGSALPDQKLDKGWPELSAMLQQTVDSTSMAQFSAQEFRNRLALRADARGAAAEGRAATKDKEAKDKEKAFVEAKVDLFQQEYPNATSVDIEAVRTGVKEAIPKVDSNAPEKVKLAQYYKSIGLAKTDQEAAKLAMQSLSDSPEKIRVGIYEKALTANMGDPVKAQEVTDKAMAYFESSAGAKPAPAASAKKGDTQIVKSGPNKGKTAVYDGVGWALQ